MKKLYHYTSIETLYNMLEKSIIIDNEVKNNIQYLKMWATHIEYLNDETERKIFTNALKKQVYEYTQNHKTSLTKEQNEKLESLCRFDAYIISLSTLKDDLNMWRGYGGNGIGINLEFDLSKINRFYESVKSTYYKMEFAYSALECKYFKSEQCEVENSLIERIYNYILKSVDNDEMFTEYVTLKRKIENLAIISKHSAYESEKEWRFKCTPTKPFPNPVISNGIIKPYIEFRIPLDAITSITIGPCIKDDYKIKSIIEFVNRKFVLKKDKIEVKFSNIPYRH